MDLSQAYDHPAKLLEGTTIDVDPDTHEPLDHGNFTIIGTDEWLRDYERNHRVTFAALDNEALATVHELYLDGISYPRSAATKKLLAAVNALLGLEDE